MTRKSISLYSMVPGYTKFTILSYAVTVLLVFSSSGYRMGGSPQRQRKSRSCQSGMVIPKSI